MAETLMADGQEQQHESGRGELTNEPHLQQVTHVTKLEVSPDEDLSSEVERSTKNHFWLCIRT